MAQFIFQALQSLASIKPTAEQGQRTVQQVQALMERLENAVKKVLDSMRTTVGVGVTRLSAVHRPVGRQLTDKQPTVGRQLADRRPTRSFWKCSSLLPI